MRKKSIGQIGKKRWKHFKIPTSTRNVHRVDLPVQKLSDFFKANIYVILKMC